MLGRSEEFRLKVIYLHRRGVALKREENAYLRQDAVVNEIIADMMP